jgi:putative NADH-flavin reductase
MAGKYRLGTDQLLTNDQGESYISMEDKEQKHIYCTTVNQVLTVA